MYIILFQCFLTMVIIVWGRIVVGYPALILNSDEPAKVLVFPESQEDDEDSDIVLSPHCHNQTFCESLNKYPTNFFYDILEKANSKVRYGQYFRQLEETEPRKRLADDRNNFFICPSTKSVVFPKAAYNVRNELRFIYNLDGYRQGVSIEVCLKKSKCKFYDNIRNFRTQCKQKFVEKLLLTADENGKPYVDRYYFPSACACSYKDENNYFRFSTLYT